MICDAWDYSQRVAASEVRMAAHAVRLSCPGVQVTVTNGRAVVEVEVSVPWWAVPGWGFWARASVLRSCRVNVPKLCGWCPALEVTTCRR